MEHPSNYREGAGQARTCLRIRASAGRPEINLFDARGKPTNQKRLNQPTGQAGAKPKTERQPPATDADTNDIFKHSEIPRDPDRKMQGLP